MRILVSLDGCSTVMEVFWAEYDSKEGEAAFFTLDDDVVCVKMSGFEWNRCEDDLLRVGFKNLCCLAAYVDE